METPVTQPGTARQNQEQRQEQRQERIRRFITQARETGLESGLLVSGGGAPRPDGTYGLAMNIRFVEDEGRQRQGGPEEPEDQ